MRFLFFFKQKTAYEMRISDWSSDVCSSDLPSTTDRHPIGGCGCPTTAARGSGGWWWPIETCQLPLRGAWYSLGGRHPWNVDCYVSDGASLVSAPKWGRSRWSLPEHTIRISLPCPSWSLASRLTRPWISAGAWR